MQRIVDFGGTDIVLDTVVDTGIYLSPRPESAEDHRFERGRDLYIMKRQGKPDIYYVHRWTIHPYEEETINIVTEKLAERFLEQYGMTLAGNTESGAGKILANYGYGILEEF